MSCVGDVCFNNCHLYLVARCDFDRPSTDQVVGVVRLRIVGASNEATAVIPVRVTIGRVHGIRNATSFNYKKAGLYDRSYRRINFSETAGNCALETNLSWAFNASNVSDNLPHNRLKCQPCPRRNAQRDAEKDSPPTRPLG